MDIIETTPKFLITVLLLLLILPALSMILGYDLGFTTHLHDKGCFYTLLYFSLISTLSILIFLLAVLDFYTSKNKAMFTIGISYLFTAFFNTYLTASYKCIFNSGLNVEKYEQYFWFISNTLPGVLISFGLSLLFTKLKDNTQFYWQLLLTAILIIATSFWLSKILYYNYEITNFLTLTTLAIHPFALMNFLVYSYILCLYPYFSTRIPGFIAKLWLYISLFQTVQSLYILLDLMKSYDAAFIGSSFLQLMIYFLLFVLLLAHYVSTYFRIVKDHNKIKAEKDLLKQLSYQDLITKLPNRRSFELEGALAIEHAHRYGSTFAIVFLDIDNFKLINDTISHHAGDQMIQEVATRLRKSLRVNDFCARIGGDEFGIILIGDNSKEIIQSILSNLSRILDEPYYIEGKKIENGVSLGFASYPEDGSTLLELLKHADSAMYLNKEQRKKQF